MRRAEAVVLANCNLGGTGQVSEGFIYTMRSGRATLLRRIEGGASCPEKIVTTKYKLSGASLTRAGQALRQKYEQP